MNVVEITIDPDKCNRDAICVLTCPEAVFLQSDEFAIPEVVQPALCVACGHCVAICPAGAITHSQFPPGSIKPVDRQEIPSVRQVEHLLQTRRSIRAFRDRPVSREQIEQIIDAARFAPTADNTQSTQYLVVQDKDIFRRISQITVDYLSGIVRMLRNPILARVLPVLAPARIKDTLGMLGDLEMVLRSTRGGKDWILHDPAALLVFHASTRISLSDVNASLALHNAALMAQSLGLGCFYAGYFLVAAQERKELRDLLSIPPTHQVYGALAIGYPLFTYHNWIERRPPRVIWL
jgi:nitroreductase/NAD-dependent dihydropyrimidine dehydrogenase PreA subunit